MAADRKIGGFHVFRGAEYPGKGLTILPPKRTLLTEHGTVPLQAADILQYKIKPEDIHMKKKNWTTTRRRRIAIRKRIRKADSKANELFIRFESGMFGMHSHGREYRDSDAPKEILRLGRYAMIPVAARLQRMCADMSGRSLESYWHQFIPWTYLVNDMLRRAGRQSPYSSQTPYANQNMQVYIQACLDCYSGKPQAPQIHEPNYVPAAVPSAIAT